MAKINVGGVSKEMKRALDKTNSETDRLNRFLGEMITGYKRKRPIASKAGFCPTANWFAMNTNADGFISPTMKLYQGIGNGVEAEIVSAYERNSVLLGTQVLLPTPFGVDLGGFIDMIALNGQGEPSLYEIKTCSNIPNKIKPEHAAQVAAYWIFSGFERCYVIYVSRKVQNYPDPNPLTKVFSFDPSEYENEINNVFMSLVTGGASLPPSRPSFYRENNECSFCSYKSICWDNETNFMLARDYAKFFGDASVLKAKVLKERKTFVSKTLENCLSSVSIDNEKMLEGFISEAKKK